MRENETEKNQTIRISEQTYNRLSELGKVKETFNDVIERLINFYTSTPSSSIEVLKKSIDFPPEEEYKQIALQLFERILSLGDDVSFTLKVDPTETPLIESRKNNAIFYKGNKELCLVRTGRGMVRLYLPTKKENTELLNWKDEWNILEESGLKREMNVIKRLYEDL